MVLLIKIVTAATFSSSSAIWGPRTDFTLWQARKAEPKKDGAAYPSTRPSIRGVRAGTPHPRLSHEQPSPDLIFSGRSRGTLVPYRLADELRGLTKLDD